MDKVGVVYIHNRILFSHKKNENLPFIAAWIDLEGIMVSEISQTEKDKYCMVSLRGGIKKYSKLVSTMKKRGQLTGIKSKLVVTGGEREWEG